MNQFAHSQSRMPARPPAKSVWAGHTGRSQQRGKSHVIAQRHARRRAVFAAQRLAKPAMVSGRRPLRHCLNLSINGNISKHAASTFTIEVKGKPLAFLMNWVPHLGQVMEIFGPWARVPAGGSGENSGRFCAGQTAAAAGRTWRAPAVFCIKAMFSA